jgi:hypothetical protein
MAALQSLFEEHAAVPQSGAAAIELWLAVVSTAESVTSLKLHGRN